MIELLGWICLVICLLLMIYHHYMHAHYEQVYELIKKEYDDGTEPIEFPTKNDHADHTRRYAYCIIFLAMLLIGMNLLQE